MRALVCSAAARRGRAASGPFSAGLPLLARMPPPHTALLVRGFGGFGPTDAQVRRWGAFAQSCRDARPRVLFSVSLDVTNRSRTADFGRLEPARKAGALLHSFTDEE